MKRVAIPIIILTLMFTMLASLALIEETVDTTAPLVTIESPDECDILYGPVDIYGTILEDIELSHYNISIYPGNADFMDFSTRLEGETKSVSASFSNQNIYTWDTTAYTPGEYLIRLAARDKAGNRDLSEDAWLGGDDSQHVIKVAVVDKYVYGGGQILEEIGDKKKDWFKISFGGTVGSAGIAGYVGDWQINFHNVGVENLDKAKFHGTNVTELVFAAGGGCVNGATRFTIEGTLNGIPGYKVTIRAGDGPDTARITLYEGSTSIFDTSDKYGGEFVSTSECHGIARTTLDNGDITIVQ